MHVDHGIGNAKMRSREDLAVGEHGDLDKRPYKNKIEYSRNREREHETVSYSIATIATQAGIYCSCVTSCPSLASNPMPCPELCAILERKGDQQRADEQVVRAVGRVVAVK